MGADNGHLDGRSPTPGAMPNDRQVIMPCLNKQFIIAHESIASRLVTILAERQGQVLAEVAAASRDDDRHERLSRSQIN